ncbi:MAG: hypothetical protein JNJ89_00375 [Rubrivivax sp.]|nr:hypothetical protein [Rubrivivax sp.]
MSLFAHFHGPARGGIGPQDLELVHARYVAMPALLWVCAGVVALLVTAVQGPAARLATQVPVTETCEVIVCTVHGA